jgi:N-acyl-D-aspartate/D-glutamate deacylase
MVYDLPAGMPRLMQTAVGYEKTFVSGEVVQENGKDTGARPGRIVRSL